MEWMGKPTQTLASCLDGRKKIFDLNFRNDFMTRVVKNQLFGDKRVNLFLISKQKLFNFLLQSYILQHTILLFNSDVLKVLKNFQSKYKCPVGIQESKKVFEQC